MIAPFFGGHWFDRLDAARSDPGQLAALLSRPDARLLRLDGLDPLLSANGRLTFEALDDAAPLALLGLVDGAPVFASLGPTFAPPRPNYLLLEQIDRNDAPLYAAARSLVDWHSRHGFCARCGRPTDIIRAGWGRRCSGCGAEHFPRVDPVVIMLAEHDGEVLLGRQPQYPPGRYSALAGFVEPGESIEDAVARELFEEAGVRATQVRYLASQPWPFPSSLMIGCIAAVAHRALAIDRTELEDAFWVSRNSVRAALDAEPGAPFLAPPPWAIARDLLEAWLAGCDAPP